MPPRVNQPRCPSRSQWPPCSLFWPCKVTKMTRRGWGNIEDLRKCLLSVFTGWELCSAPPCGDVSHRPHVLILEGLSQGRHLYGFTFSIISSFCFIVVFSTTTIGTRQSKQCGFSIYTFDNLKSKSMVRLVRGEKMVLSGLVFARKIARMILIQNI